MKSQGCGGAISHSQRMRPMFTLRDGSPSICLPKATALHKQMSMDLSRDGSPCICLPKATTLHKQMSMDLSRDGSPCSCLPKATALHQEMSMDLLRDVYPSICLPKATTLGEEPRAVRETNWLLVLGLRRFETMWYTQLQNWHVMSILYKRVKDARLSVQSSNCRSLVKDDSILTRFLTDCFSWLVSLIDTIMYVCNTSFSEIENQYKFYTNSMRI